MRQRPSTRTAALAGALALAAAMADGRPAGAFGGEDPALGNPWYHEQLTRSAAAAVGFTGQALDVVAWHADYIDAYLYNPAFWAQGGLSRFKAARAAAPELVKLHFDDNAASDQLRAAWRRYLTGAMAGLIWAAERGDVHAARNIVGVSLHAIQDFYAHSSWVDTPDQRHRTWFETAAGDREGSWLWTGFYEHPDHLGIRSHGKISAECSLMRQAAVRALLELGCVAISPLSNSATCQTFRSCIRDGASGAPGSVLGVPVPGGVVYYHPPGIALDSRWLADIAVQQRGLTDITGGALFDRAHALAERTSVQWLETVEAELRRLGHGAFWDQVKTAPASSSAPKEGEYERYDRLPFQFLSAGPYPAAPTGTEWYLRVTLTTSGDGGAGTDGDVSLVASGRRFRLDYLPDAGPILSYNDFEAGDRAVYTVGPFPSMPDSIRLENDAADVGDVADALFHEFADAVEGAIDGIGSFLLSLIAGHADLVGVNRRVWSPAELMAIGPAGAPFALEVDGGGEGHYVVHGWIRRWGEHPDGIDYQIALDELECVSESDWDRGSNSDEPFLLAVVAPFPGHLEGDVEGPFEDIDDGDRASVRRTFVRRVPSGHGAIALAVAVMEHDDEGSGERGDLLDEFMGRVDRDTRAARQGLTDAIGAAVSADWKLAHVEVYAFTRGDSVAAGTVLDAAVNHWIEGDGSRTYALGPPPPVWIADTRRLEELFPVAALVPILARW